MADVLTWRGDKAYARCPDCRGLVRANKPLFGSLHICLTDCEQAGRHVQEVERRRGPFWNRRTEVVCTKCHEVRRG